MKSLEIVKLAVSTEYVTAHDEPLSAILDTHC